MTMADSGYRDTFPRGALIGAGMLLMATLAVVAYMRLFDIEPTAQVTIDGTPAATRALQFEDRPNGDVIVYATGSGQPRHRIAVLEPGTNGFLRAVMRGLVQARKLDGIGPDRPFQLSRFGDGRLVLSDPATGRNIYLRAFGPTNAEAFARLLPQDARRRQQLAEHGHG